MIKTDQNSKVKKKITIVIRIHEKRGEEDNIICMKKKTYSYVNVYIIHTHTHTCVRTYLLFDGRNNSPTRSSRADNILVRNRKKIPDGKKIDLLIYLFLKYLNIILYQFIIFLFIFILLYYAHLFVILCFLFYVINCS